MSTVQILKAYRLERKGKEGKGETPHTGDGENEPVDNSEVGEPDPAANNMVMDGYAPPGGMGEFGKFQMREDWRPDDDLIRRASLWGIVLQTPVTDFELAEFITYWKAEGKAFHHDQWLQKLARSVQASRAKPVPQQRRDVNAMSEPDTAIPPGFRG